MNGLEFTNKYGEIRDKVTPVDPAITYNVRAAADHHTAENQRAQQFVQALDEASHGSHEALIRAGRLLYAAHLSNVCRIQLGSPETQILMQMIHNLGPTQGFYGAKITGTGGTVAILCDDSPACREKLAIIEQQYAKTTNMKPNLFLASSPGAAMIDPTRLTAAELFQ